MLLYPPDPLKCHLFPWKSAGIKLLDFITFSPTVVTRTQNTCTCIHVLLHILNTLNWLSLFWLTKSVHWIFEIFISTGDFIYCSCRLYNNLVKDTQGLGKSCHVWPSSAWFLRVIMSNLRALCCLPSFKKQKQDFHFFHSMYNKTFIIICRFSFCDIQNNQGLVNGFQPQPSALADNPCDASHASCRFCFLFLSS